MAPRVAAVVDTTACAARGAATSSAARLVRRAARSGPSPGRARAARARSRASCPRRRAARPPPRPSGRGTCGSRAAARSTGKTRRPRLLLIVVSGRVICIGTASPSLVDHVCAFLAQPRVLDLDVGAERPGMRVEDDHRAHLLLLLDRDLARDRLDRAVERERGDRRRVAELVARVLVRGLDRGAGERVVELVEEERASRLRVSSRQRVRAARRDASAIALHFSARWSRFSARRFQRLIPECVV